jgi:hypothetical protein
MTRRIGSFLVCCVAVLCVVAWLNRSRETAPAGADGVAASHDDREVAPVQVRVLAPVSDTLVESTVENRAPSSAAGVDRRDVQEGDPNRADRVQGQLLGFFSRRPNLGITSLDVRCGDTSCIVQLTGLKPKAANQLMRETMADDLLDTFVKNEDLSLDAQVTNVSGNSWELRFRFLSAPR